MKIIETKLVPHLKEISNGELVLESLLYSYLEPVSGHLSNTMKDVLKKLNQEHSFLQYEVLTKQGDRKQKDISYAAGEFKIQRLSKGQVILP